MERRRLSRPDRTIATACACRCSRSGRGRLAVLTVGLALFAVLPGVARAAPKVDIVFENPKVATLAVDQAGRSYGISTNKNVSRSLLYRSGNQGRSWSSIFRFFGSQKAGIRYISVLSDGTLLAHVDQGPQFSLFHSVDQGAHWAKVFVFPAGYRTLTAHSVTDDGTFVYVGSYTGKSGDRNKNWIWRAPIDDLRPLTFVTARETTTHRHIHFVQWNPDDGRLYVGYGDSDAAVSIRWSSDQGTTWHGLCFGAGGLCRAVDIAFDPSGFAVYGKDTTGRPGSTTQPQIILMDLATGDLFRSTKLPGPSYSALRLTAGAGAGDFLVGTVHEPCCKDDGRVHLFAGDGSSGVFTDVFSRRYLNPKGVNVLSVQFQYPNGDFPIRIDGYGTIIGRVRAPGALPPVPWFSTRSKFHTPGGRFVCRAGLTGGQEKVLNCTMPGLPASSLRGWWMRGKSSSFANKDAAAVATSPILGKGRSWEWGPFTCKVSSTGTRLRCENARKHGWVLSPTSRKTF